jgi:hypothetical protein
MTPTPIRMGEKTMMPIRKFAICLEKETIALTELSRESKNLHPLPVIGTFSVI